ncbi:MAG: hypothetical protein ACO1SV_03440 [Fimbriimonas sp.]
MRQAEHDLEGWKRMVLRSMPRPAWLSEDAPHVDVVLSTRTRVMRNLTGHKFPNRAADRELERVMRSILAAADDARLPVEVFRGLTTAERDHLVNCRLVSHDFPWTLPNRALLVDADRALSLMVNEEDHLRLQALSAGWSIESSDHQARACVQSLAARLPFARHPEFGYLSASPYNCGAGRRRSAMFHLIGLAQSKRLPAVLQALGTEGLAVRGLFGEASRAMGAFVQVSATRGDRTTFAGACEYLIREERTARGAIGRETLAERAGQARDFAVSSLSLTLADALRALGWIRWAAAAEIPGFDLSPRDADAALTTLDLRGAGKEPSARQRADVLRGVLRA